MTDRQTQRLALLLRGINIGGKRIPMAELRALLTGLGHTDVSTILASGQAVVTSGRDPGEVAAELEERLASEVGLKTEVMVRTGAELREIVRANPFPTADAEGSRHAVVFLRTAADARQFASVEQGDHAPDEFHVEGREIYLRVPGGFADSKLAMVLKPPKVPATTRNWNTVKKLEALTQ